jgi:hypothetical protein
MGKHQLQIFLVCIMAVLHVYVHAQTPVAENDTFFLAKKKGLLGRLGRSISTTPPDETPQKVENPFLKFKGKIIRSVDVMRLSFQRNIYDTSLVRYNFGVRLANIFHKNSTEKVIKNNLFFEEGGRLFPYLVADNERYLRSLSFIQDARIIVDFAENSIDSVDVLVITKDIFSLGLKLKVDDRTRGRAEISDDNIAGSGTRLFMAGLYDAPRKPQKAYAAELLRRNFGGSFIDFTAGFSNYASSYATGRREEARLYARLDKPLVTPFVPTTGSLEAGIYKSYNAYNADSFYKQAARYEFYNIDGWFGYSLDNRRRLYNNREIRIHNFIALRAFTQQFSKVPQNANVNFDTRFANAIGLLAQYNIFKQVFYKTNFIYGFGRNEDVPEGFSIALVTGLTRKFGLSRPYSGFDVGFANFNNKGYYTNYTFRTGSYIYRKAMQDVDLLFNIEHFTKLKKVNSNWYRRYFINGGITSQINPVLNAPLSINSEFGLPYFNPENIGADLRTTTKMEAVFYNTKKILGFRLAPFVFTDVIALKPVKKSFNKTDIFTGIGGGLRTRNENLVFGTIEIKAFYFPRTNAGMDPWKIDISTNIRFRYNSSFIRRPDFVSPN